MVRIPTWIKINQRTCFCIRKCCQVTFFFSLIPNFAKVFESRPCAMFKTARNIPETSGLDVHFKNLYFYQLRREMFMGTYISKGNGHILKNYLAVKKTVRPLSGWRKTHMEIVFCSSKLLSHIIYVCAVVLFYIQRFERISVFLSFFSIQIYKIEIVANHVKIGTKDFEFGFTY